MSVTADPDAFFNLHMFKAGRVLSEQDVADIQKVLADYNEELESQVDIHEAARTAGLHAIGGDELVKAVHAKDEATTMLIRLTPTNTSASVGKSEGDFLCFK